MVSSYDKMGEGHRRILLLSNICFHKLKTVVPKPIVPSKKKDAERTIEIAVWQYDDRAVTCGISLTAS